jgi:hypothetical protein
MTPTRLWWPLTDVQPLAEHAMSVPTQRITGAQACARAATQPALICTSDPTGDWLTSNGMPIWYDHDGTEHQVPALTWQHPANGATATPGQPDPAAGFLRLTHHNHPGRAHRGHRRALVRPRHEHCRRRPVPGQRPRDDIAPATATWVPANVTSPTVDGRVYPALIANNYTALGWSHPPLRPHHCADDGRRAHRPAPRPQPAHRPDARRTAPDT